MVACDVTFVRAFGPPETADVGGVLGETTTVRPSVGVRMRSGVGGRRKPPVAAAAAACVSFSAFVVGTLLSTAAAGTIVAADSELNLGRCINVFSRYGYFTIAMRVVPRNETEPWIFREPTTIVFENVTVEPPPPPPKQGAPVPVFHGDFHMEFCDNQRQLLQAYFREFHIERLDRPWQAFTGSWSRAGLARHMGINASYVAANYCYVLVRLARHRVSKRVASTPEDPGVGDVIAPAEEKAEQIEHNRPDTVIEFVKDYGSHYIHSYSTGNAVYQVFVYTPATYVHIKDKLKSSTPANMRLEELLTYFSPWYAEHVGVINCASGNVTVNRWAAQRLQDAYFRLRYPTLLKLHGDAAALKELDGLLRNEALLKLDLRLMLPAIRDAARKHTFLEVVDNYVKLWEVNM